MSPNPKRSGATYAIHRAAFEKAGQADAFARVIALVVQPGVEFGHTEVIPYAPEKARELSAALGELPGMVFEAHSTDYQTGAALRRLVVDGFPILKVGPWLTFALRQALYGLDAIADVLDGQAPRHRLMQTMEAVMQAAPADWNRYYHGSPAEEWVQRHFSYSDRIRYYWPDPAAQAAVKDLRSRLAGRDIPDPVLHQYLPGLPEESARRGFDAILLHSVEAVLGIYHDAVRG